MFLLAFFLDFFEIAFIVIPLIGPAAEKIGIDLIWLGVMLGVNMQTSFMHPPFGFALFYLRSVAAKEPYKDRVTGTMMDPVTTGQIYWGAVPFVVIQCIMVGLVIGFPQMVMHYKGTTPPVDPSTIEIRIPSFGQPPGTPGGLNIPAPPGLTPPSDLVPPNQSNTPLTPPAMPSGPPPGLGQLSPDLAPPPTQAATPPAAPSPAPEPQAQSEVPPALPPGLIPPAPTSPHPRRIERVGQHPDPAIGLSRAIDEFGRRLSRIAVWLVLFAALLSAFNAFFRYFINEIIVLAHRYQQFGLLPGSARLVRQQLQRLSRSAMVHVRRMAMFGAAYTLKVNEHVRVDLVYGNVSERMRTWIDLVGGILCLVPMCAVLAYLTWPWFVDSWHSGEISTNAGGLVRWPAKLSCRSVSPWSAAGILGNHQMHRGAHDGLVREHAYEKPLQ